MTPSEELQQRRQRLAEIQEEQRQLSIKERAEKQIIRVLERSIEELKETETHKD